MKPYRLYFFERLADGDTPAGFTVSKTEELPEGDFQIDEFIWPGVTLWFIAEHEFTEAEREEALHAYAQIGAPWPTS